jgi:hypothetical protein
LENNGSGGLLMEDGPRTPSVVWVEFVIVKGQVGAKRRAGGLRLRVKHTDEQYPSIIRGRNMRSIKCYQKWHVKKKCPNRTPCFLYAPTRGTTACLTRRRSNSFPVVLMIWQREALRKPRCG